MNGNLSTIYPYFFIFLGIGTALQAQNVGIGTATPLERLDVSGDLYVRGDDVYFSHDAGANINNDYFSFDDVNALPFQGNGIVHFHADGARGRLWTEPSASISAHGGYFQGRVAIGTQTPQTELHMAAAGPSIMTIEADTDNANEDDNARIEMYQDNRSVGAMVGFSEGTVNNGNTFRIALRYGGITDWSSFTIDAVTKHVGIGTSVPDQRLEVNGGGIQINQNFGIGFRGEIPFNGNVSNDAAHIYGEEDFGGTSVDFIVFEKTDINQVDPDGGIAFTNKGSDNVRELGMILRGNGRVGLRVINPTYQLQLQNNAAIGLGRGIANAWITYSDGRLKSDRKALPYGLATVLQLNPMHYFQANSTQHKNGAFQLSNEGERQIGFIAQELHRLVPEAVIKPKDESSDLWGVDYTRLVPVLTKAIQEQQEEIQALKERCNALEAQLKRS